MKSTIIIVCALLVGIIGTVWYLKTRKSKDNSQQNQIFGNPPNKPEPTDPGYQPIIYSPITPSPINSPIVAPSPITPSPKTLVNLPLSKRTISPSTSKCSKIDPKIPIYKQIEYIGIDYDSSRAVNISSIKYDKSSDRFIITANFLDQWGQTNCYQASYGYNVNDSNTQELIIQTATQNDNKNPGRIDTTVKTIGPVTNNFCSVKLSAPYDSTNYDTPRNDLMFTFDTYCTLNKDNSMKVIIFPNNFINHSTDEIDTTFIPNCSI